jgi:hypothetical protein
MNVVLTWVLRTNNSSATIPNSSSDFIMDVMVQNSDLIQSKSPSGYTAIIDSSNIIVTGTNLLIKI